MNQAVHQYLVKLEQQNPTEEPVHEQKLVSTTESGCDLCDQGWNSSAAGLLQQLLVDNHGCVIVGAVHLENQFVLVGTIQAQIFGHYGRGDPAKLRGEMISLLLSCGDVPLPQTGKISGGANNRCEAS